MTASITRGTLMAMLLLALALPASAEVYEITVENLIPGGPATGQPMTPPVGIVHGPGYDVFNLGAPVSPGLEIVAEDGDPTTLIGEANANPDVIDVNTGGGPFFDMTSFFVEGSPGDLFSLVTMLARTNDLFTGVQDVALPADQIPLVIEPTTVWDAGSEVNTGMIEHIPFYGNGFVGPDEFSVVTVATSFVVVNDPDHGALTWQFPPAARITIELLDPTATVAESFSGVKSLY